MLRAKVASSIQHSGRAGRGRDRSASTAAIVGTWMASGWRAAPRAEQAGRESKSSFLRLGGHQVPSRAYLRTLHVRSMLDNTQTQSHCTNRGRRTENRTPAAAHGREPRPLEVDSRPPPKKGTSSAPRLGSSPHRAKLPLLLSPVANQPTARRDRGRSRCSSPPVEQRPPLSRSCAVARCPPRSRPPMRAVERRTQDSYPGVPAAAASPRRPGRWCPERRARAGAPCSTVPAGRRRSPGHITVCPAACHL